jgi:RsiW-degrading membrane proteinase PrsW (M82 family)
MENVLIISIIATVGFCLCKFVEMRFIEKDQEPKPMKFIVRDALIVFMSVMVSVYVYEQFDSSLNGLLNTVTETKVLNTANTEVFTDTPGF